MPVWVGAEAWTWHLPGGITQCNLCSSQCGSRGQLRGLCQWLNSKKCFPLNCRVHRTWRTSEQTPAAVNKLCFPDGTNNWKMFLGMPRIQQWQPKHCWLGNGNFAWLVIADLAWAPIERGSSRHCLVQFQDTYCECLSTQNFGAWLLNLLWGCCNHHPPSCSQRPVIFIEDYYWSSLRVGGMSRILAIKLFSLGGFTMNTLLLQIFLEKGLQKLKLHQPLKTFPACIIFSLLRICHRKSKDV